MIKHDGHILGILLNWWLVQLLLWLLWIHFGLQPLNLLFNISHKSHDLLLFLSGIESPLCPIPVLLVDQLQHFSPSLGKEYLGIREIQRSSLFAWLSDGADCRIPKFHVEISITIII